MSSQKMSNKQLVLRIKAGENVADNMLQLWQQNQGFIRSIAKKYAAYEEIEDLIQQGYFGMRAVLRLNIGAILYTRIPLQKPKRKCVS